MSIAIEHVTIGGASDGRIVLQNSQIARGLSIGTSWTRLRIAMRVAFDDQGVSIQGAAQWYFGLLSSPSANGANGPLTNNTSHFLGFLSNSAAAGWTRETGPIRYSFSAGTVWCTKKVGSTKTQAGSAFVTTGQSALPASARTVLLLEFLKGSPNWTIGAIATSNGASVGDVPLATLKTALVAATMADAETTLDAVLAHGRGSQTIAVDEGANGSLNAISLAWDRTRVAMHVSEILFAKIA